MADSDNKTKAPTHTAYAFKREGKKFGRWLEIGTARAEGDGPIRVFLDRLPIGGFTGGVLLSPIGEAPPLPEPKPQRPEQDGDGEEGED
jgi:hypothetical protein